MRGNCGPLVINVSIIGFESPTPASMYTATWKLSYLASRLVRYYFLNFHYCVRHSNCHILLAQDFRRILETDPYCIPV